MFGTALCLLAGCSSSSDKPQAAAPVSSSTSTAPSSAAPSSTVATAPHSSARPTRSVATGISIPPNLCAATDVAQNTADAYMGALSAGDEKEAVACVYANSVPLSLTRSLLAHQRETAVYLPAMDGLDGPTQFDYLGNGLAIRVTVTSPAQRKYWVTGVTVHKR
ncbi:MAG TPA: hypothetical protein VFD94_12545 [Jatrophihabitans sp.]|nr:hypothetical protein [Jatrophihabitans sp.]